jgi:hypothetical protein
MPFLPFESLDSGWHRTLGLARRILNLPPAYFVKRYNERGLKVSACVRANQEPLLCHLCGFAIVSLSLSDNWIMETCSATGLKQLLGNRRLEDWKAKLAQRQSYSAACETEKGSQYLSADEIGSVRR